MKRAFAMGALAMTACAAGCTTAPGEQPTVTGSNDRQCFIASQVNGFRALDEETVHVTAGVNTVYELEIAGACPDVDWSQRIGIRSLSGSSWVCRGYDAELLVPGPLGMQRCPVLSVRKLTPAEAQALAREIEQATTTVRVGQTDRTASHPTRTGSPG